MVFKKGNIPWNKNMPRSELLRHKKINYCVDCGKEINKWSKRCQTCSNKATGLKQRGENHPNYRKDRPTCKICGKIISSRNSYFCRECYKINCGGKNHYNFGKHRLKETKIKLSKANIGRVLKEETKIKMSESRRGAKNPSWIDGRTPLTSLIRGLLEYTNWKIAIFKRDNRICQKCGEKVTNIEAHHIKQFSIIFSEFLKEYDQFSPIEDKETLLRLATKYEPFWDLSNGKTLCKDCHKNLTNTTV